MEKIAAHISSAVKFHKAENDKGLRFEPPICFIPHIATPRISYERVASMLIHIID